MRVRYRGIGGGRVHEIPLSIYFQNKGANGMICPYIFTVKQSNKNKYEYNEAGNNVHFYVH